MTTTVLASLVQSGNRKSDGKPFRFCILWVMLDDGSAAQVSSRNEYAVGDVIELAVITRYGKVTLIPAADLKGD